MDEDRGAVLTVRAACQNVIDFRQARLLDPAWWRRYRIVLNGIAKEDDLELQRNIFNFHLALVGNSGLTEDSFKSSQERARDTFFDIMGLLRPWEGMSAQARKKREVDSLREEYIKEFGDPSDPEFQRREQESLEVWRREREEEQQQGQDPEERIYARRVEQMKDTARKWDEYHARRLRQGS